VIILALAAGGAFYLQSVVLPKSMESLGRAVPSLVNATLDQAARLSGPEALPTESRIVMGSQIVGELTLQFKVGQDRLAANRPAASSARATGLLQAFESPDSSIILNGRLRNGAVARKLREDSLFVALVAEPSSNNRAMIVRILPVDELGSAERIGFLWLPADSLILRLHRVNGRGDR
jgi:hypothetical protein